MASITLSGQSGMAPIRPINILRDLGPVADLIEICFRGTMDPDGQRYLNNMRNAANMLDSFSPPLSGFVWEQDRNIVGNVSLIAHSLRRQRIVLIANVAVHPDFRRQGIGRALTARALEHARRHGAQAVWLHVRADNPGAIALYRGLGFEERDRRTTWELGERVLLGQNQGFEITPRPAHHWIHQKEWLRRTYPDETTWYRTPRWELFEPGIWSWLYRFFVDFELDQWSATKDGRLHGVLAWLPGYGTEAVWPALAPGADEAALTALLLYLRAHRAGRRTLKFDYPAGQAEDAIRAAGFQPLRTLVWMKVAGVD
jgi:GNAT superfamily N-acetyltransferase